MVKRGFLPFKNGQTLFKHSQPTIETIETVIETVKEMVSVGNRKIHSDRNGFLWCGSGILEGEYRLQTVKITEKP